MAKEEKRKFRFLVLAWALIQCGFVGYLCYVLFAAFSSEHPQAGALAGALLSIGFPLIIALCVSCASVAWLEYFYYNRRELPFTLLHYLYILCSLGYAPFGLPPAFFAGYTLYQQRKRDRSR